MCIAVKSQQTTQYKCPRLFIFWPFYTIWSLLIHHSSHSFAGPWILLDLSSYGCFWIFCVAAGTSRGADSDAGVTFLQESTLNSWYEFKCATRRCWYSSRCIKAQMSWCLLSCPFSPLSVFSFCSLHWCFTPLSSLCTFSLPFSSLLFALLLTFFSIYTMPSVNMYMN